jgi:hypothetical protein
MSEESKYKYALQETLVDMVDKLEAENLRLNQLLRFVWDVNKPHLDEDVRKAIRNYYDEKMGEER